MGQTGSRSGGKSVAGELEEGKQLDVLGEDNEMWWPACVTRVDKKKNEIIVEDETGYVQTIKLNKKKHQKRLAQLGTHTRNARAFSNGNVSDEAVDNNNKDNYSSKYNEDKYNLEYNDDEAVDSSFNYDMFVVDRKFDILDIYKSNQSGKIIRKWRPATIVEVFPPNITVKFDGWEDKHNITLDVIKHSSRIKPFRKKTVAVIKDREFDWESEEFYTGQRVMALDRYRSSRTNEVKQKWRESEVLDVRKDINGKSYYVHYKDWSSDYDRWIPQADGRIMSHENYDRLIVSEKRKAKAISKDLRITQERKLRNARKNNTRKDVRKGTDIYENVKDEYTNTVIQKEIPSDDDVDADIADEAYADEPPVDSREMEYERKQQRARNMNLNGKQNQLMIKMPRNVKDGLVGLHNLGNTCFMNACLQCLFNTIPMASFFLNGKHRNEVNPNSPTRGQFAKSFGSQLLEYWHERGTHASHSPTELKSVVSKFVRRFSGFAQHDAQEFLRYFLDGLHEDLNRVRVKPEYREIVDDPNEEELSRSYTWWENYCERNDSCIKDIFCGQLRSYVTCKKCKYRSSAYDPFWDLSVPIKKGKRKCKLQDCLKNFTAKEDLKGSDAYYCSKCKKHRTSSKVMTVQKWPPVLVIHIKRFHKQKKLNTDVSFPTESLNLKEMGILSENSEDESVPLYDLYGVANHMGSTEGGHYTADCKNPISKVWYNYDDSHVSESSISDLDGRTAYMLFYCRRDISQAGRVI